MRLYVKLVLMIAVFAGPNSATGRRMTGNLAYEIRVGLVCAFGNDADYERLVEYTGRLRAEQIGCLDAYLARHRYRQRPCITSDGPLSCACDRFDGRLRDGEPFDQALTVEGDQEKEPRGAGLVVLGCAGTTALITGARGVATTLDDDDRP
jgi:hypothetical protein